MSLEQKVGQVFAVAFAGSQVDAGLQELIEKYHIGGVIFFARNVVSPAQVSDAISRMQTTAVAGGNPGLLVFVDQEGGRVARLTEDKGFTEFPGAMAIGATQNPENARLAADALAQEMKAVGFNGDFAPVLDVNNNPSNPVIGIRSFGSDPKKVAQFGLAFIDGLQSQGLLAFGKHFPGHGDTGDDSHVALPVVSYDLQRLNSIEFVPFKAAIQDNVAGIMSAHIVFPTIEDTPGLPATLSPKVLTGLLRNEMGFHGLIVTDSLEMGALASSGYPLPLASAAALSAGADMLLSNSDYSKVKSAYDYVLQSVKDGKIPMSRLDAAVLQVLETKARFKVIEPAAVDSSAVEQVGNPETKKLSRQIAAQSITLLRNNSILLPLQAEKVLVVETSAGRGLGSLVGAQLVIQVSDQTTDAEINQVTSAAAGYTVILGTTDADRNLGQAKLVKALLAAKIPLVVAALRGPYDLMAFPEVSTYLVTYGSPPPSIEALAAVLTGKAQPQGHLPVDLPGLYSSGAGMTSFQPAR